MEETQYRLATIQGELKILEKELKEFGPERFMHGAGEREQKAREGFAALFFIIGLKKLFQKEWWILQKPDTKFPDFEVASFSGTAQDPGGEIAQFELVTIPGHCKDFEEMYSIVRNKFRKGYDISEKENLGLLIFINHKNSTTWVQQLVSRIGSYKPFREVWTVHLLFNPKDGDVIAVEINRIRPFNPIQKQLVSISDPDIKKVYPAPDYMVRDKNGNFVFKEEIKADWRKKVLRKKYGKYQA